MCVCSTRAVQFSPTGRSWAAASTEGLLVYSLDESLFFNPYQVRTFDATFSSCSEESGSRSEQEVLNFPPRRSGVTQPGCHPTAPLQLQTLLGVIYRRSSQTPRR